MKVCKKYAAFLLGIVLIATASLCSLAGCSVYEENRRLRREARLAELIEEYKDIEFNETGVSILLTKEATYKNLNKEYTLEDFSGVDAIDFYEFKFDSLKALVQKKLDGETLTEEEEKKIANYRRSFELTLKEPGRENVLMAKVVLEEKRDVDLAEVVGFVYEEVNDPYAEEQ